MPTSSTNLLVSTVVLEMKLWTQQLEMQSATEYVRTDLERSRPCADQVYT